MSNIIEEQTGKRSFLICDSEDVTIFYRTGTEIATYFKKEKRLELRRSDEEVKEFMDLFNECYLRLNV